MMRRGVSVPALAVAVFLVAALLPARVFAQAPGFDALERAIAADPENLALASDYRQQIIAAGKYDRSIGFFEKVAGKKGSGPNVYISLALARVDKVPGAGEFSRLYLARDAMGSLTKSIELRPSVLAYYIRGLINLYFNQFIFKRVGRGIADLQTALGLITRDTPTLVAWHVHAQLGDGYWRNMQPDKAREVWKNGLSIYPDTPELVRRVNGNDETVEKIVHDVVDPDLRVDTTLKGWLP